MNNVINMAAYKQKMGIGRYNIEVILGDDNVWIVEAHTHKQTALEAYEIILEDFSIYLLSAAVLTINALTRITGTYDVDLMIELEREYNLSGFVSITLIGDKDRTIELENITLEADER